MKEREGHPSRDLFPLKREVAEQTRGVIRYMYKERYEVLRGHLPEVLKMIPHSGQHETLMNEGFESQPDKSLGSWYTLGLTISTDAVAFQSRSVHRRCPVVRGIDVATYRPLREYLVPEDWFQISPEEVEMLADRLRKLLIGTDDSFYLFTDAMREFYIGNDGEVSPFADMAYLSGIADVMLPVRYAYDRIQTTRDAESD